MLVAPATAEWNDASAFILVTRAKKARREIPMADAEIDVVRDILAGDRAVRDCGSAPEQGAGRVDRCREVDDEAREPLIERLT